MSVRKFPVRPDLAQLRHQARDLHRAVRRGDAEAIAEFREHNPRVGPASARLSDAQHVLARGYQASSWLRLLHACELIDAIWRNDVDGVMALVTAHPDLLHEHATIRDSNWGPPMTYAANLGRDRIIRMLHKLGARDTNRPWDGRCCKERSRLQIGECLLDRGMDPAAPAAIAADGIGGYTALFSTVVSQQNFWVNYGKGQPDDARFTRLLLDRGANPNMRASLRHRFEGGHGGGPHRDYRDVTPLGWADRFPQKVFVSRESVRLLEGRAAQR